MWVLNGFVCLAALYQAKLLAPSSWDFSEQASAQTPFPTQIEHCTYLLTWTMDLLQPYVVWPTQWPPPLRVIPFGYNPVCRVSLRERSHMLINLKFTSLIRLVIGLKSNQSHGVIPGSAQYDAQYTQVWFSYYTYSGCLGWWL